MKKRKRLNKETMDINNSNLPLPLDELEKRIGYVFSDKSLITTALTHSSYSNEAKSKHLGETECNERLEFLGDSVLSIIVSKYIFIHYDSFPEGELTKLRAGVVCEKSLGEIANTIGLGDFLRLGKGEELNGGRTRISILADAFEALLGAIFLDSGDLGEEKAQEFLMPLILVELNKITKHGAMKDYKTLLQQIVQQADGEKLEYVLKDESGPAHMKTFTIEAHLNSNVIGHGIGKSKREAEQAAAREALSYFGEES